MKIVRAQINDETFYGVLEGQTVKRLALPPYNGLEFTGDEYALDGLRLLAPAEPTKIVAVGKNYKAHADEMGEGRPEEPLLFLKPSTCIVGNGDDVISG